jgi:sigma-B regulation protein RsbU (phosphoserine phosphatase)
MGVEERLRITATNPTALYERGYTSLGPGSVLLFYTDGITEAENAEGEMFEVARLRRLLRSREWTTAEELVREVYQATRDFSNVDPSVDDQTVVAVIRRRVSERTRRRESHGSR